MTATGCASLSEHRHCADLLIRCSSECVRGGGAAFIWNFWRDAFHEVRCCVTRSFVNFRRHGPIPPHRSGNTCVAARLLSDHFRGEPEVLAALSRIEEAEFIRRPEPGVLGHLVRGWPTSAMAVRARAVAEGDQAKWSPRDRLLCAIAWSELADAEQAARELIARRYPIIHYSPEDVESLRLWAKTGCCECCA